MNNEDKILQILTEIRTDIGSINQRLDNHDARFDRLENRFDNLEIRFDNLEVRFDNNEARFDNLETKVGKLEQGQGELLNEFKYVVQVVANRDDELRKDIKGIQDILLRREQEEGRLLAILSEGHTGLRNTQDMQEFRISSLESASKRHDIEIAFLRSAQERRDTGNAALGKAESM